LGLTILFFIVASLLDVYSTSTGFKTDAEIRRDKELGIKYLEHHYYEKDPLEFEKNRIPRWFIKKLGVNKGLIIHRLIIFLIAVVVFYLLYRFGGVLLIGVYTLTCIYFGIMVKQYVSEYWRKGEFEKIKSK
jgi:hypothetical protein